MKQKISIDISIPVIAIILIIIAMLCNSCATTANIKRNPDFAYWNYSKYYLHTNGDVYYWGKREKPLPPDLFSLTVIKN